MCFYSLMFQMRLHGSLGPIIVRPQIRASIMPVELRWANGQRVWLHLSGMRAEEIGTMLCVRKIGAGSDKNEPWLPRAEARGA